MTCSGKKVVIDGKEFVLQEAAATPSPDGVVIVRTRSAGVHVGVLKAGGAGMVRTLLDATRVWRWRGANTLSELSQKPGDATYTRISEPVPEIELTECLEIIPCSAAAATFLRTPKWPTT